MQLVKKPARHAEKPSRRFFKTEPIRKFQPTSRTKRTLICEILQPILKKPMGQTEKSAARILETELGEVFQPVPGGKRNESVQ
jgi:hypothetical protein